MEPWPSQTQKDTHRRSCFHGLLEHQTHDVKQDGVTLGKEKVLGVLHSNGNTLSLTITHNPRTNLGTHSVLTTGRWS